MRTIIAILRQHGTLLERKREVRTCTESNHVRIQLIAGNHAVSLLSTLRFSSGRRVAVAFCRSFHEPSLWLRRPRGLATQLRLTPNEQQQQQQQYYYRLAKPAVTQGSAYSPGLMIDLLNSSIVTIAGYAGLPPDPLKIIVCLLLSYPLAAVLKRLPDDRPVLKNLYCIASGLFFLVGIFDLWGGLRTLFISCAGTWLLSKYFSGPMMPWINFLFIMGHMSVR